MNAVSAIEELFSNYKLIILTLIVAIIGGVITGIISLIFGFSLSVSSILGLYSPFSFIERLIILLIVGIFYMLALAISVYAYKRRWDISMAFSNLSIYLSDVIIAGIAIGLVMFIFSFIPIIGTLIEAFVFMGLSLSFSISERGRKIVDSMEDGFSSVSRILSKDPLSLLILYIASILSLIPILNIITIPYVAILSTMLT
ncbi:hypothetical protein SJAV_01140 [Sulfurisphaera javensis]|uniref:Uncharacterized protein n=1 Tax=Sulfurisphaera javensis TaxID=2049879 RepID=A0AAT9GNB4_9CREN